MGELVLPLDVEDFLVWLAAEKGRSPNTLRAYRRDLSSYIGWLEAQGRALDGVEAGDIDAYVASLRDRGLAPASVKRATVAVRSLHRFRADEGLTGSDPASSVETPRVPAGLPKALREDEVASLLDAVVGDDPWARRDRAVLEVLYGTGARISEVCALSLGDVDLDGGLLRLLGKGSKERVVPLGRFARIALATWLADDGRGAVAPERFGIVVGSDMIYADIEDLESTYRGAVAPERFARRDDADAVFLNRRGGRLSRQGAWGIVRKYGRLVGLDGRLTPHVLRHSCATHMLDHGADIRAVQELLGHASIATTQVYTMVSNDRLFAVYDQAHPRARVRRR